MCLHFQASYRAPAFSLAALGNQFYITGRQLEITKHYIAAAKADRAARGLDPAEVDKMIGENPIGFAQVRLGIFIVPRMFHD